MKILNIVSSITVFLTIVSSFLTVRNLHFFSLPIPQPVYFFLFITTLITIIQIYRQASYCDTAKKILQRYYMYIVLFFFFIIINSLFYLNQYSFNSIPSFSLDLLRIITMILFAYIIIIQLINNPKNLIWITVGFFTPLILSPLILLRDTSFFGVNIPSEGFLFTNYSLQAFQYSTTSLATWLIITFSLSTSFLFYKIKTKNIFKIFILSLCCLFSMSLIWWTNSRGAIISAVLISTLIGYISHKKQGMSYFYMIVFIIIIVPASLYILPSWAKSSVFVRYFPQDRQQIENNNVTPSINTPANNTSIISKPKIENSIHSLLELAKTINLTHAQARQVSFPIFFIYTLNHPLGMYGPAIFGDQNFSDFELVTNKGDGSHNTLLQAGLWGGLGCFVIILIYIIYTLKISYNLIKEPGYEPYIIAFIAAFFGIFILVMLNDYLHLKTFWIIPAIIIAYSWQKRDEFTLIKNFKVNNKS